MDKRVDDLISHSFDETREGVVPSGKEEFRELNLPPNPSSFFHPDPSFILTDNSSDHPLLQKEVFEDTSESKPLEEEIQRNFFEKQNKKVNEFWKNKLNN